MEVKNETLYSQNYFTYSHFQVRLRLPASVNPGLDLT